MELYPNPNEKHDTSGHQDKRVGLHPTHRGLREDEEPQLRLRALQLQRVQEAETKAAHPGHHRVVRGGQHEDADAQLLQLGLRGEGRNTRRWAGWKVG